MRHAVRMLRREAFAREVRIGAKKREDTAANENAKKPL